MKRVLTVLILGLLVSVVSAQAPQKFKYQLVLRGADGQVLVEKTASLRIKILQGSESGSAVYTETHSVVTNSLGLVNLEIGGGVSADNFSSINWSIGPFYLQTEIDESGGTSYILAGVSPLLSVPYALFAASGNGGSVGPQGPQGEQGPIGPQGISGTSSWTDGTGKVTTTAKVGIGTSTPTNMLSVQGSAGLAVDSALFMVKDKNGAPVFAVYENGVRVYIGDGSAKGGRGGFAVGGRAGKGLNGDLMWVTPDSIRFYFDETIAKGGKGGFAVGGRTPSKSTINSDYFNISGTTSATIINPSKPSMLWYPKKEAFLVGRVLIEKPDSVGTNSVATGYESKAIGNWSQAFGYQTVAKKDYSTAIGKEAKAYGYSSFAFGNQSRANGDDAYSFGSGAIANGSKSFAFGSVALDTSGIPTTTPTSATGLYSYAIGMSAQAQGKSSFSLGSNTTASADYSFSLGYYSNASGVQSIALNGTASNSYARAIGGIAEGYQSTAIGYKVKASGSYSIALGSGYFSKIITFPPTSTSKYTQATGKYAIAIGHVTLASGWYSTSLGYYTEAQAYMSTVLGRFNTIAGDTDSWVETDPLFVVGNGVSDLSRNNAVTVYKSGRMDIRANEALYGLQIDNASTSGSAYGLNTSVTGASTGTHYGLYASASGGATNYAGYFSGNVYLTSTSQLGLGITPTHRLHLSGGAYCDGGTWVNGSDRNLKENISAIDNSDLLNKIDQLPIMIWNYKTDASEIKHIGPMAQDFYSVFGLGGDDKAISTIDPAGISLAAIQELNRQNKELKNEIELLKAEMDELRQIIKEK
jgi:hypothetical protein